MWNFGDCPVYRLEELALIGGKASISRHSLNYSIDLGFVTHKDLSEDPFKLDKKGKSEKNNFNNQKYYEEGTILLSLDRAHKGIGLLISAAFIENGICSIKITSDKIIPEFLYHYLLWCRSDFLRYKRLRIKTFSQIAISVPPLSIQKHIVTLLDKIKHLVEMHKDAIKIIEKYYEALFLNYNNGTVTTGIIGDYILEVERGARSFKNNFSGIPLLKEKTDIQIIDDLSENEISENIVKLNIEDTPIAIFGDILLEIKTQNSQAETEVYIHNHKFPISFSNKWIRIKPSELVLSEYLAAFLKWEAKITANLYRHKSRKTMLKKITNQIIKVPTEVNLKMFNFKVSKINNILKMHNNAIENLEFLYETRSQKIFERQEL
ncbi:restriction endonuclease subunit S [Peribacillus frigoritolerans]